MKLYSKLGSVDSSDDSYDQAAALLMFAAEQCGLSGMTYSVSFTIDGDKFVPSISVSSALDPAFITYGVEGDRITTENPLYPHLA